jgi:hypothetical protein
VATTVEVDKGSLRSSLSQVTLGLGLGDGLESSVEAIDIGLVVLGVVELHDLGANVRLESIVVVCSEQAELAIGILSPILLMQQQEE